ncbi:MAG: hypothetical protein OXM57_01690 [bacterium]|nr:hypothetical protein [bacterium]MDE0351394.1 hypothetical protein [bacterium]
MESSEANLDTSERVRIAFFGVGSVATAALNLCRQRSWMDLVAAVRSPSSVAGRLTGGAWAGVRIWTDPEAMLDEARPEVALIATRSELDSVLPLIRLCAREGVHVVSTSEELAWPDVEQPGAGASLQRAAEEAGVVIAAAGINPGFAFDALPLVLAAAAWDVSKIVVQRTLDASVFGRDVHRSLGIGYTEAGFRDAVRSRRVRGHIGFAESARVIADGMGWEIERFEEEIEPVLADRAHVLAGYTIEPPETAGVVQLATALVGGREWLRFELSLHVAPGEVDWETRDRIRICGENELELTMEPGMPAVSTTAALLVNAVPGVLAARPGFYPPGRLLPNPPWLAGHRPPATP